MLSSPEPVSPASAGRPTTDLMGWNRRAHYYLGLYFLFFVWLFALTGLLLNHNWEFARPNRNVTSSEQSITAPAGKSALDDARDLSRQLGITGEIEWVTTRADPARLDFRVNRPGLNYEIKTDLQAGRATVQRSKVNPWLTARVLHTFTGVRVNDPRKNERDWILTTVWALAMDAVALGLVAMVATGLLIWWRGAGNRLPGVAALLGGVIGCGFFLWGLRWMAG